MQIPFSEYPGRHERHFRRKIKNPLFPRPINSYSDDDLLEVQRLDHEEIIEFITQLRAYVCLLYTSDAADEYNPV